MHDPVMGRAEQDEPLGIVAAALGLGVAVVHVAARVLAAGHRADAAVPAHHRTAHCGRDHLARPFVASRDVDAPDDLRVALGHLHHLWPHRNLLAVRVLRGGLAALADRQRDLVPTPCLVRPAAARERARREQLDERVVVQVRAAALLAQHVARLPQQRVRGRRQVKGHPLALELGPRRIARPVPGRLARRHALDL
ncbi:MAG: hypothetical protein RIB77_18020 [Sandaracinaceae bacterium]